MTVGVFTTVWCHRAAYAGLAAVYGAGCFGWLDSETVKQVATAIYLAMVALRR